MAATVEGTDFVKANLHAKTIADAAICAYWSECGNHNDLNHHRNQMKVALDDLCAVMGLRVVDAEVVDA